MKTIILTQPIIGHQGPIASVVLREPTASDYFALGEPSVFARNPDGTVYAVENTETVRSYIERCVVEPKDPLLLGQLNLRDAMTVKDAVLDFFAAAQRATSPPPSTSSSPTSAG